MARKLYHRDVELRDKNRKEEMKNDPEILEAKQKRIENKAKKNK